MIFRMEKLTIILEDDEIERLKEILWFAKDYDAKDNCMTTGERKLLNQLLEKFGEGSVAVYDK